MLFHIVLWQLEALPELKCSMFAAQSKSVFLVLVPISGFLEVALPAGSPSRSGDVTIFVKDINQPSLPTPFFYSVLVSISLFMALSTVFHSIKSPDNSPFSHFALPVLSLPHWSFLLYVFLWKSPSAQKWFLVVDWAQNTNQLTNYPTWISPKDNMSEASVAGVSIRIAYKPRVV